MPKNAILLIFFVFWKTVIFHKIQFVMSACNGLLLLF